MTRKTVLSILVLLIVALSIGAAVAVPHMPALKAGLDKAGLGALAGSYTAAAASTEIPAADPLDGPKLTNPGSGGDTKTPAAGDAAKDASKDAGKDKGKDAKADNTPKNDAEWIKKLDEWKTQDPREIIKAKYKDLEGKKTKPWDENDPQHFIPQTGRNDPLSPVLSELPDELKQLRGGEDNPNEIEAYAYAAAASGAVDTVMAVLQCYNVVQIGTEKLVTIGFGGGRTATVPEGRGFTIPFDGGGVAVEVNITILSVSTEEVQVGITGSVPGTDASVSKTQVYIPRSF